MEINILPIGLYGENVYLLHENNHVLIIDPGDHAEIISKYIGGNEILDGIILTHGHEDHTKACDDLMDMFLSVKAYIHPNDLQLIDPKHPTGSGYDGIVYHHVDELNDGDMKIGIFELKIVHTPGHTSGSVCIIYRNIIFSGDTLFAGSIGRTDLFSGNESEIIQSLKILSHLPKDMQVLPGHGPKTTIGHELKMNPFLINI